MARSKIPEPVRSDPRWITVQLQIRVPWWRAEQLRELARQAGVNVPNFLADAVDRLYPPEPPTS